MRRHFVVCCATLLAGLAAGRAWAQAPSPGGLATPRMLEIYATTDLHGHLETPGPRPPSARGRARAQEGGGLALLGGYLKNIRARHGLRTLLLDGGDLMQGTLASNLGEGATMIRGLNELRYTAAAVGNHEFDYGPTGPAAVPAAPTDDPRGALGARRREAGFPLLAANVRTRRGDRPFDAYALRDVDGVRVAIIGATTTSLLHTTAAANVADLVVEPIAPAILDAAARAVAEGARVLIVVMHAGAACRRTPRAFTSDDRDDLAGCAPEEGFQVAHELAAAAARGGPKIAAIVGGHTHQVATAIVDGMPFVQAGQKGSHLAHVSIEVTGRGATAAATGRFAIERPIEICARVLPRGGCATADDPRARAAEHLGPIVPDAAVAAAIAPGLAAARAAADRPIGAVLVDGLATSYGSESPLGNFAADALRAAAAADIGVINGGGLRADLPAGPLTFGALYESFPFDNEVVPIEITGAQLRRVAFANLTSPWGILSISGLRVVARCAANKLEVELVLADGRPVAPDVRYRLATVDFLVHGGDGVFDGPIHPGPSLGVVRAVMEEAFKRRTAPVRADDPAIFDPAHPRVALPSPRPVRCAKVDPR